MCVCVCVCEQFHQSELLENSYNSCHLSFSLLLLYNTLSCTLLSTDARQRTEADGPRSPSLCKYEPFKLAFLYTGRLISSSSTWWPPAMDWTPPWPQPQQQERPLLQTPWSSSCRTPWLKWSSWPLLLYCPWMALERRPGDVGCLAIRLLTIDEQLLAIDEQPLLNCRP
jgi:hypothetical protein